MESEGQAAAKQAVVFEVPIGSNVTSVALSPDFAWIAAVDRKGAAVVLVDATTGKVMRSIGAEAGDWKGGVYKC